MEERISELEDRNLEMIKVKEERELRFLDSGTALCDLSDTIQKANIRIMSTSERETFSIIWIRIWITIKGYQKKTKLDQYL